MLLADKAYDADERVIDLLQAAGKTAVIPPKANRKVHRDYDRETYKARHLIEISLPISSNTEPSRLATTKPREISSQRYISWPQLSGSNDDRP